MLAEGRYIYCQVFLKLDVYCRNRTADVIVVAFGTLHLINYTCLQTFACVTDITVY